MSGLCVFTVQLLLSKHLVASGELWVVPAAPSKSYWLRALNPVRCCYTCTDGRRSILAANLTNELGAASLPALELLLLLFFARALLQQRQRYLDHAQQQTVQQIIMVSNINHFLHHDSPDSAAKSSFTLFS